MKIHVATIKDARRRVNEAFDCITITLMLNADVSETGTKTYRINLVNTPFLLSRLFSYTDTTSGNIADLVGKSIRVCLNHPGAIGHPTKDLFVMLNREEEIKLEDLENYFC